MKPKVLIIVGPTASGKSDLAVQLAKALNGEVISADSRQVYTGLDIGSGKITNEEMQGIPHHLLDVADPKKQFSVSDYKKLARGKIEEIIKRDKLPILVGGSGFYLDAVTGRASLPEVPPNKELREELEGKTTDELLVMLEKKDPTRAQSIDQHNKVRLVRALEIVEALGKVPGIKKERLPYEFIWIGLKPEKETLEADILKRIHKRLNGTIREAEALHKNGLTYERMEELGLEYRYLARLLQNKITKEEFETELYSEIKKYAKRQDTWFKANKDITWFGSSSSAYEGSLEQLG
jgi:tRNA dimethylallyltransferase